MFDQEKYHIVLVLVLGYYDKDDDKVTISYVRIDFNEFTKIIWVNKNDMDFYF